MKNIHLIATDKPSRLHLGKSGLVLCDLVFNPTTINSQNIYITNSEKPKARDWVLGDFPDNPIGKVISKYGQEFTAQSLNGDKYGLAEYDSNKIILTDDKDLIKDGVQAIDDEFLEWFVKNPSCEEVEVIKNYLSNNGQWKDVLLPSEWEIDTKIKYKIIIPREKPKQYPIGGYTPGFYSCTCVTCKEDFQGHKRATQCEHCAIKMTQKEPKPINNCPKCGLDLVEREGCKPVCTRIDCGGIILSNETLKEWALKEEPKQEDRKICKCKRAYENPLSEICSLCWNELYPNEKDEIKEEDLLEPKQEEYICPHPELKRNYDENGCYKCWKCGKILVEHNNFIEQETLEEVAERIVRDAGIPYDFSEELLEIAKWQAERMYSEKDMIAIVEKSRETGLTAEFLLLTEQFKKK